jgi:hypothetical protein
LDILQLIKTVLKLKAGITAVIGDDEYSIRAAKQIYYSNQTLYLDADE